jgi:squalene-associated FAD-dependent desaturase
MSRHVAVIGGGLAGLAAACTLAERGARVTLLESRARLGGATFSFERSGTTVDNGQHVLLRCYDRYRSFLDRIGSGGCVDLQPRFDIPVGYGPGRVDHLTRTPGVPAPLHLSASLARYGPLPASDRLRALPAALALRFVDPDDPASDERGFGEWLASHGQRDRAVRALWDLITVAALNTTPAQASLALAARVFRTALLERAEAADIGVPTVGLSALHAHPAQRYLRARGAGVHTRSAVREIDGDPASGSRFRVRLDGGEFDADSVVVAVPPEAARAICPAGTFGGTDIERLGAAPIVNIHAVYSRRVLPERFLALADSPVQWVFDRSAVAGIADGQYLAVSISAAERWIDEPTAAVREAFLPELRRVLPATRDAELREFFVTRERRATFRQAPGSRRFRPAARTAVPGLALAGAWVYTGWPDTMEGAVRSGETAAAIVESRPARTELHNAA